METYAAIGYEALLRGPISTEKIIEKAVINKIISKLDLIAHKLALSNFITKEKLLFLNVHPHSLESITNELVNGIYKNNQIVFEITEQTNFDALTISKLINLIRKYNIQVALDDFGSGFNNINLLSQLDINYVKIDKSIIQNMSKKINEAFIEMIVAWSKDNNIKVIAEGIETKEQYDKSYTLGIEYGQGWYFAKPNRNLSMLNKELAFNKK